MTTITIKEIRKKHKTSKAGKPYTGAYILIQKSNGEDLWLSGYWDESMNNWKQGMQVQIEYSTATGSEGQIYHNFKNPNATKGGYSNDRIQELESRVSKLENSISSRLGNIKDDLVKSFDDIDPKAENIPF